MIQRIKTWFSNYRNYREKRRRKQILKIIKEAKQVYLDGKEYCMCFSFIKVEPSFFCYDGIVEKIPEFKPSTFGLHEILPTTVWWDILDRESRINAFNKLIEIYSKQVKINGGNTKVFSIVCYI